MKNVNLIQRSVIALFVLALCFGILGFSFQTVTKAASGNYFVTTDETAYLNCAYNKNVIGLKQVAADGMKSTTSVYGKTTASSGAFLYYATTYDSLKDVNPKSSGYSGTGEVKDLSYESAAIELYVCVYDKTLSDGAGLFDSGVGSVKVGITNYVDTYASGMAGYRFWSNTINTWGGNQLYNGYWNKITLGIAWLTGTAPSWSNDYNGIADTCCFAIEIPNVGGTTHVFVGDIKMTTGTDVMIQKGNEVVAYDEIFKPEFELSEIAEKVALGSEINSTLTAFNLEGVTDLNVKATYNGTEQTFTECPVAVSFTPETEGEYSIKFDISYNLDGETVTLSKEQTFNVFELDTSKSIEINSDLDISYFQSYQSNGGTAHLTETAEGFRTFNGVRYVYSVGTDTTARYGFMTEKDVLNTGDGGLDITAVNGQGYGAITFSVWSNKDVTINSGYLAMRSDCWYGLAADTQKINNIRFEGGKLQQVVIRMSDYASFNWQYFCLLFFQIDTGSVELLVSDVKAIVTTRETGVYDAIDFTPVLTAPSMSVPAVTTGVYSEGIGILPTIEESEVDYVIVADVYYEGEFAEQITATKAELATKLGEYNFLTGGLYTVEYVLTETEAYNFSVLSVQYTITGINPDLGLELKTDGFPTDYYEDSIIEISNLEVVNWFNQSVDFTVEVCDANGQTVEIENNSFVGKIGAYVISVSAENGGYTLSEEVTVNVIAIDENPVNNDHPEEPDAGKKGGCGSSLGVTNASFAIVFVAVAICVFAVIKKAKGKIKMKNIFKRMCSILLLFTVLIGFTGMYDFNFANALVVYKRTWNALDEQVKHDTHAQHAFISPEIGMQSTGGYVEASSGAWMTNWIYTDQKSTVLCELDNVKVPAGYYKFTTDMSVQTTGRDPNQNICEIRVQDSETGENLAYRMVKFKEYKGNEVRTDIVLEFYLPETNEVDFFINAIGSGGHCHRCFNLTVETSSKEAYLAAQPNLAGAVGENKNISFEEETLYYFDLLSFAESYPDSATVYDVVNSVVTLQGLVNREGQRLFLKYQEKDSYNTYQTDEYWLNVLTGEGGELADKKVVVIENLSTLFNLFKDSVRGLAVWDENVPSTENAALTASGVCNLLPVRYNDSQNSLMNYFKNKLGLETLVDLNGKFTGGGKVYETNVSSTGSAKCDAYIWAMEKYLKTGKTNPSMMANFLDAASWDYTWQEGEQINVYYDLQNCFLTNKDYYIQNKAFFFDLGWFEDVLPGDDLTQPMGTDFNTLCKILEVQNERAGCEPIEIGGFVAWFFPKYTDVFTANNPNWNSMPGAVDVEWRASYVYGWYNAYTDADAQGTKGSGKIANASIYSQISSLPEYKNKATCEKWYNGVSKQLENVSYDIQNVNYVCVYMGDYDSSAWVNTYLIDRYLNDPVRGQIPLAWGFTNGTAVRAPHVINRLYQTATENDYFVGGDNGVWYNDPGAYIGEDRPKKSNGESLNGTLETYEQVLKETWAKYDIDIMGFLISTQGGNMEIDKLYAKYAKYGIFTNYTRSYAPVPELIDYKNTPDNYDDDVPTLELKAISNQLTTQTELNNNVDSLLSKPSAPTFTGFRAICMSPTMIKNAVDNLSPEKKVVVVDPYTFMRLYKEYTISQLTR